MIKRHKHVKGCQSKMELADMKGRLSGMHPQKKET